MAQMLPFINPATGEQFGQVDMATVEDVTRAVEEMRQNAERWRRYPLKERIRILRKLQAFVIDSLDIITETVNKDTGKSRQDALIEVTMTSDRLHQYYRRAPHWLSRERVPPGLYVFRRFYTVPKPYGVVAVIAPWNYPFDLSISPLCSALLAGNTVILKPSEVAGATGLLIEKLIQSVPELSALRARPARRRPGRRCSGESQSRSNIFDRFSGDGAQSRSGGGRESHAHPL